MIVKDPVIEHEINVIYLKRNKLALKRSLTLDFL